VIIINKVFIVAPTFKEPDNVERLLQSIISQNIQAQVSVFICNSNPGDRTSFIISNLSKSGINIFELEGCPEEYWSATVNRGLVKAMQEGDDNDVVVVLNVDIVLDKDALANLLLKHREYGGQCQLGGLGHADGAYVPSGFRITNRWLALNLHPFSGLPVASSSIEQLESVDALVGRLFAVPVRAVRHVGLIPVEKFPHYNADLVYSFIIARSGFPAYIVPSVGYESDRENTGFSVYSGHSKNILFRLRYLFSIKNPSNPSFRFRYIKAVFPYYLWPSVCLSYVVRTFLEVLLGGEGIRHLFGKNGRGY
jgi:GT2 family glycosyltransferase